MLVQVSGPPHCDWGVEWSASWIWQSDTPVQSFLLPFPQGNRSNYMNRKYILSGQMLLPFAQLVLVLISCCIPVRSSGHEGETFLLACNFPELLCWKRWARISREKHCLQPGIVPDAAWSAYGHLRQVSWASCIILGILSKTKLFNLLFVVLYCLWLRLCSPWCSNVCACGSEIMVCMQFHISWSLQ